MFYPGEIREYRHQDIDNVIYYYKEKYNELYATWIINDIDRWLNNELPLYEYGYQPFYISVCREYTSYDLPPISGEGSGYKYPKERLKVRDIFNNLPLHIYSDLIIYLSDLSRID